MEEINMNETGKNIEEAMQQFLSVFAEYEVKRRAELIEYLAIPKVVGRARREATFILEDIEHHLAFCRDIFKRILVYAGNDNAKSDLFMEAISMILESKVDEAYELLSDEKMQKNGGDAAAYILKAQIAEFKHLNLAADEYYTKAVETNPSYENCYYTARFYFCSNQSDKALLYFNRALQLDISYLDRAGILTHIGRMAADAKNYPEAAAAFKESLEMKRKMLAQLPQYTPNFLANLKDLGDLHYKYKEYRMAKECFNEALKGYAKLAKNDGDEHNPAIAKLYDALGNVNNEQKAYAHAEEYYKNAIAMYTDLLEKEPKRELPKKYLPELAEVLMHIGGHYKERSIYAEAQKHYLEAMDIYKELVKFDSEEYDSNLGICLSLISYSYMENREYRKAEPFFVETLKAYRSLATRFPKIWTKDLAQTLVAMASFYTMHIRDKKLSVRYANEAVKVLQTWDDKEWAPQLRTTAKHVLTLWKKGYK
ncbi:MAG: tetratricopeptide repeat protein [Tannerellaceae bacterium]|jgi:tetratricopeptide (TPR) repeat protein|nr:tetratricopeptide repeat protein [Tannerellaceae bacterium]